MDKGQIPDLGRLDVVSPRDVWRHEAHHFTPWLLANADVLADLLGMDLELEVAEHAVGGFSLDLLGKDLNTGRTVIVENQLETSDHTHLGQILTYAAGTDPATIVWMAPTFRAEHRAALDWLNTRTDEETRFFGVEIAVVRIGESVPAPMFKLIAQPNDWEKTVRAATHHDVGPREQSYQAFWGLWLAHLQEERPGWSRATRPPKDNWFSMTAGSNGANFVISFGRRGLASELHFEDADADLNAARFQSLLLRRSDFEAAYGLPLDFNQVPGRKSSKIGDYLAEASVKDEAHWNAYVAWFIDRQTRLRTALASVGGIPAI